MALLLGWLERVRMLMGKAVNMGTRQLVGRQTALEKTREFVML
jgi:hypothetical protein